MNNHRKFLLLIFLCTSCILAKPAKVLAQVEGQEVAEVDSIRLYLPDAELGRRLVGHDIKSLAGYIKALEKETAAFWSKSTQPKAKGMLIAVGIKPGKKSRVWCEAIGGEISADVLRNLEKQLGEVTPPEVKEAPIAFAINTRFRGQNVEEFPVVPKVWVDAAKAAARQLRIPDDLFKIIWPG